MILDSIGIAGYRSFGNEMQYISELSKVNILIGKNNSGKSNIIRFLSKIPQVAVERNPYSRVQAPATPIFDALSDIHKGTKPSSKICFSLQLKKDSPVTGHLYNSIFEKAERISDCIKEWDSEVWIPYEISNFPEGLVTFQIQQLADKIERNLTASDTNFLASNVLNYTGGGHNQRSIDLAMRFNIIDSYKYSIHVVPAYRKITAEDKDWELQGTGLIKKLNQIKEPLIGQEDQRTKFNAINTFVQEILGDPTAKLDIPYTVDDIYVEMDSRRLPLESLGTGIHQVILLAMVVTLLEKSLVCIEELEIYLHPELQKKFIKYITDNTDNQYIITTHSSAVFDAANVNIYHCWLENGQTKCELAVSSSQQRNILDSLGYRASDLLQSNCIIWVEGPSDRIYLNKWIFEKAPQLKEGLNYSIMFYGGRLLSHLSGQDDDVNGFIQLGRMNRNVAIVIDSDKRNRQHSINETKKRVSEEIQGRNGYQWISKGREIENYYKEEVFHQAIKSIHGETTVPAKWGQYEDVTIYHKKNKEHPIDKIKVARKLTENPTDFSIMDLNEKVEELIEFIKRANGTL